MAKTILNLKLNYRGKHLDTIRQGADFHNDWYIGSDKHLFWQILDDSNKFPKKHKLLIRRGTENYLLLPDGSNLTCSKDGRPLDANSLQQNGILSGSQLKLSSGLTGTVQVNPDYEIQFEYTEPVRTILRPEEQAVVQRVMQSAPMSASERTETGLILLFLILGLAFVLIYDQVIKPKLDEEKNLTEMMAAMERVQRIEPQLGLTPETSPDATAAEEKPEEQTQASDKKQPAKSTTKPGKPSLKPPSTSTQTQAQKAPDERQIFGNNRPNSPTSPGSRPQSVVAATNLQSFVTARPGAKAGQGLPGTSSSTGSFNPRAGDSYTGSFNPDATSGFDSSVSNMPGVAQVPPSQRGTTNKPGVPTQTFAGDASKLQPYQPGQWPSVPAPKEEADKVTQSVVKAPDISKIPVPEVKIPKPVSSVPDANIIYSQISARKGQIEQSYKRNSAIKKQTGSITIAMDIAENGTVSAKVTSNSATFTSSFLNEIKGIVESWRFNVSQATKYQFRMNLTQA